MCCCMCLTAQLRILITYLFHTDTHFLLTVYLKIKLNHCARNLPHTTAALLSRVGPYFLNVPPHSPCLLFPMSRLWNSHRPVMFMKLSPFLWMSLQLILQRCLRFCHLHTQMGGTSSVCLIVRKTQLELMVLFLFVCFIFNFYTHLVK